MKAPKKRKSLKGMNEPYNRKSSDPKMQILAEAKSLYKANVEDKAIVFTISKGGRQREYKVEAGYGYFISAFKRATHIAQITEVVDTGIASKEIESVVQYLGFKVPEIAKAAAVSPSTVSRWRPETSIGPAGTNQFFKIDEVIKKGVDLFGGPGEFKTWLDSPNVALGNQVPAKILTSQIGVELVDEALDALHFGTVM